MTYPELKEKYWNEVGDEKLFPNHSDQDIWDNGFKNGWDACVEYMARRYKDDLKPNNSTAGKPMTNTFTVPNDGC